MSKFEILYIEFVWAANTSCDFILKISKYPISNIFDTAISFQIQIKAQLFQCKRKYNLQWHLKKKKRERNFEFWWDILIPMQNLEFSQNSKFPFHF